MELVVYGNVTTMRFTAVLHPDVRFGVTIASTGNGLLVTSVEADGAGAEQSVEVGDFLIKQDGDVIPHGIGDAEFVAQLQLVVRARPVELGFIRQIDNPNDPGAAPPSAAEEVEAPEAPEAELA